MQKRVLHELHPSSRRRVLSLCLLLRSIPELGMTVAQLRLVFHLLQSVLPPPALSLSVLPSDVRNVAERQQEA